jgi:hypothetical protein
VAKCTLVRAATTFLLEHVGEPRLWNWWARGASTLQDQTQHSIQYSMSYSQRPHKPSASWGKPLKYLYTILMHNQRDATLYNDLYCCQWCFEQFFRSSSGAQKLYMQHRYLSNLCVVAASLVESLWLNQACCNNTQVWHAACTIFELLTMSGKTARNM